MIGAIVSQFEYSRGSRLLGQAESRFEDEFTAEVAEVKDS
jgi:hypothetical protein